MDKSLLKKAAIQSVALMVAIITFSYASLQYQTIEIYASNLKEVDKPNTMEQQTAPITDHALTIPVDISTNTELPNMATSLHELKDQMATELKQQLSENYLVIKKPTVDDTTISLEDIYIKKSIKLVLTGEFDEEWNSSKVMRVRGEDYFLGDPEYREIVTQEDTDDGSIKESITKDYGKEISQSITFTTTIDKETGLTRCEILLELDKVYAYEIYEDKNYFFIDLREPSDVYDRILVIDPGHGGKDAGALSKGETYYEKNINLGIVQALKELLDKEDIKVYYTRTTDETVFLRPRVTLANAVNCDYFISIHCNSNVVTSPNGMEVLYYDTEFKGIASGDLANLFSQELGKIVGLRNRGTVLKRMGDIFIMDKAQVPMILIEIGYMSNSKDLNYLVEPKNQRVIAEGIYNSIMQAFEELPVGGD